jgi:hypothetical protein
MSLPEWKELFEATIPELLILLDFARPRRGGTAATVLAGGTGTLLFDTAVDGADEGRTAGFLRVLPESRPPVIEIQAGDRLLGRVPDSQIADVASLLAMGIRLRVSVATRGRAGTLAIELEQEPAD